MNQHSPWLHNLAREQLDARNEVKREQSVAEVRALQQSIEADLAALKRMADRVHAKDCSFEDIIALLDETCAGIETALRED
jgi:2-keto-4-pentenoate hydratase